MLHKMTVSLFAQAAMMGSGAGSLGGVTSAAIPHPFGGGPGPAFAPAAPGTASVGPSASPIPSASPARVPPTAATVDIFGGDLFGAESSAPQPLPTGSPARPPPPSDDSPHLSQTNSPARRASKSAFDDLNDSIRAALGTSPAKHAPMQGQAGQAGQAQAPVPGQLPQMAGVPGVPVVPGSQPPAPGLVGFGSPARQPAVAGD